MTTPRIRMSHPYGQTPPNVFTDFDWIHHHEKELLEQYGECAIIVYKAQVIGTGSTYDEALQNAERNLPPGMDEITQVYRRIYHRYRLARWKVGNRY